MMTVKEAYLKAKKEFPDYRLIECVDIGDTLAFYFSPSETPIPGIPYIGINKETGNVKILNIPPLKNLRLIQNGKRIDMRNVH